MKTHLLADDSGPKGAAWLFVGGLTALVAGCGPATSEPLVQSAVRLETPDLPEGGIFGTAIALEGDLLAVNAEINVLVPEPGSWVGATTIYRRIDGRWVLEDTLHSPASWMIEGGVHIIDGQVLMMTPFDGQCLGEDGEPVPQSGSIYAYSRATEGWGPPEHICAPDPHGNGALGWSSTRTQDGLLMASNPQNEAPSLVRLTKQGTWQTRTELNLPRSDSSFGLIEHGGRVMRTRRWETAFEIEIRDAEDLTQVTRRVSCPDPDTTCRAWPLSQGRLLIVQDEMAEIVDPAESRRPLTLVGSEGRLEVTGFGVTAAVRDEAGQLFLIDDPAPDAVIAPAFSEFCAGGIARVGLFAEATVLSCRGSQDVWVVPVSL